MKYHDRIFGLFDRLVGKRTSRAPAPGCAIVKKVLDKIGGRIWGESGPAAGATFFVELPQNVRLFCMRCAVNTSMRPILLVEDNPMDLDLTLQALEGNGVANPIVACRDGEEALEYMEAHRSPGDLQLPIVVLLDLRLPKVDGIEVLRQARSTIRLATSANRGDDHLA